MFSRRRSSLNSDRHAAAQEQQQGGSNIVILNSLTHDQLLDLFGAFKVASLSMETLSC